MSHRTSKPLAWTAALALIALPALTPPAWAQDTKDTQPPQIDIWSADGLTREEMVGLYEALLGGGFEPPPCVSGQEMFDDVPASDLFCPWIEELARRGITGGCGGGNYCPTAAVSRAQMAVFLTKSQFPTNIPLGVTVTGRWGFDAHADGSSDWGAPISYPARMPVSLQVRYLEAGDEPTKPCQGSPSQPVAQPGFLCIYEQFALSNAVFTAPFGNSPFGTTLLFASGASGDIYAYGTWAATAHTSLK